VLIVERQHGNHASAVVVIGQQFGPAIVAQSGPLVEAASPVIAVAQSAPTRTGVAQSAAQRSQVVQPQAQVPEPPAKLILTEGTDVKLKFAQPLS
jgi:hypothetical protein